MAKLAFYLGLLLAVGVWATVGSHASVWVAVVYALGLGSGVLAVVVARDD